METQNGIRALENSLSLSGIAFVQKEPLSAHTTFRIGGLAALAAFPSDARQMVFAIRQCRAYGVPYLILGAGSNVLAPDSGYAGCVLLTTEMKQLQVDARKGCISASAGVSLTALSCSARDAGLAGLAFAFGIPGSVGGGVYMNAGAYGGELGMVVQSVLYYDADADTLCTVDREQCAFGYRTSAFQKRNGVILGAEMSLSRGDTAAIAAEMNEYRTRRREKQPLEYPSAGSAFKRYPGYFTAQLIDEAGLKGFSVGGAQVSEKHAGFIINRGGATAADVRGLIAAVQHKIQQTHGFLIEPEIRILEEDRH